MQSNPEQFKNEAKQEINNENKKKDKVVKRPL